MKSIFYVYRTSRKRLLERVLKKQEPDHVLYGFNILKDLGYKVGFSDIAYKRGNLLFWLLYPIERFFIKLTTLGFKIDQAIFLSFFVNKYDVIITTTDSAGLPILFLKKIGIIKKPVIYISIGLANELWNRRNSFIFNFYRLLLHQASFIVVHSKIEQSLFQKMYKEFLIKVLYIPFGVDTNYFKSSKREDGYIFVVGHDKTRDYATLMKVASLLPKMKFILVTQRSNLVGLSIPNNVQTFFNLPYSRVRRYYEYANLVFLPLREINRAGGQTTFLEAVVCEKKIVLANIKGIREVYVDILKKDNNVYTYEPGNIKDAVGKLKKAYKTKTCKYVLDKKYSSTAYAKSLDQLIKSI